jgi:hypothetical protein
MRDTHELQHPLTFVVHALVYEPTTGEAKMLPVDFGSYLRELRSVYDLYRVEDDITS